MEHALIERINELARKSRSEGLTAEEKAEQQALRSQYLKEFRQGMEAMLEGVRLQRPDGRIKPLQKKETKENKQ